VLFRSREVCKLGKVNTGGRPLAFVDDSKVEIACARRVEDESLIVGRLFCRRFGDGFSGSVVPKLKVPGDPKLIRCAAERLAGVFSLDDDVDRDQRFRLAPVSTLFCRRSSGEFTSWEFEGLLKPLDNWRWCCGVDWPRLRLCDREEVNDGARCKVTTEVLLLDEILYASAFEFMSSLVAIEKGCISRRFLHSRRVDGTLIDP
jgi:hypothetical protein